jgi:carbon-monoxide dehydrogenase iron sulfur subunit
MKRIYTNESACIACHLCEVYCKMAHSQSKDLVKAFTRESPRPLPSLRVEQRRPVCFAVQCRHCDEPACVYACLTGALSKDPESGVVTVDAGKCVGCWTCILACPFGAIAQDTSRGKVIKCDLCTGKDMPACVMNCPNEALVCAEAQTTP